ncbi:ABC transporter permease [Burkholderia multivorans]|uniref:ABC transporter permease n=1 Tax=Burkholderia multivorans TaxID=87883 RepID=UPI001C277AD8|nr:ABC transporter permease [Burkholderia multivorans]MBU9344581.1 ABC transporter permease [Burkholderia multivorans]MCO1367576.1 ABC transporter permease [Burkholderia multivorans]MCO1377184.1 ABC transporter permease [Burkholderia multivorans]UQP19121.1 ABC transporter permease [Burkholderia multivorans]UQP87092.1 ABC transporter permease [Burkholderia multivorans]
MNGLSLAVRDIWESFVHSQLWLWAGLQDIKLRYRRSTLGPWWLTISTGILVASMGFLYAGIFKSSISDYLPHFAVGQVFWFFFSGQLNEATTAFTQFDSVLKQVKVPMTSCVLRVLVRNVIIFAHNVVIIVIVFCVFGFNFSAANLLLLPGFLILIITLFSLSMIVAMLCTRFRDLAQIVSSGLQILFFLSPIFWKADVLGGGARALLVKLNPVYYLIEIVRQPLFGNIGIPKVWLGAVIIMIASTAIAALLFSRYRYRITYWL